MASAPQAVGPANPSWITPYYVAPEYGRNPFTEFAENFRKTRSPLAMQVLQQRLAALKPEDLTEEIGKRMKALADYKSARAQSASQVASSQKGPDWLEAGARMNVATTEGQARTSSANVEAESKFLDKSLLSQEDTNLLREGMRNIQRAGDALAVAGQNPVDGARNLEAATKQAVQGLLGVTVDSSGKSTGSTKSTAMNEAQRGAAAGALVQTLIDQRKRLLDAVDPNDTQAVQAIDRALANARAEVIGALGAPRPWEEQLNPAGVARSQFERDVQKRALEQTDGSRSEAIGGSVGAAVRGVDDALKDDPVYQKMLEDLAQMQARNGRVPQPADMRKYLLGSVYGDRQIAGDLLARPSMANELPTLDKGVSDRRQDLALGSGRTARDILSGRAAPAEGRFVQTTRNIADEFVGRQPVTPKTTDMDAGDPRRDWSPQRKAVDAFLESQARGEEPGAEAERLETAKMAAASSISRRGGSPSPLRDKSPEEVARQRADYRAWLTRAADAGLLDAPASDGNLPPDQRLGPQQPGAEGVTTPLPKLVLSDDDEAPPPVTLTPEQAAALRAKLQRSQRRE